MNPPETPATSWAASDRAQPLARGTLLVTGASLLFVLSGYAINIVLGRALGPIDYGLFGVTLGFLTVVNAFQMAGIPQAIAKFTAERTYSSGDLLLTGGVLQVGMGVSLAGVMFIMAEPLAAMLGDRRLVQPVQIAALAVPPYALFSLLSGFNGGQGRYSRQALMLAAFSGAKASMSIGLGLVLALPGALLGYVLAPVLGVVTSGAQGVRHGRLVGVRRITQYSLPLVLLALLSMTHLHVDLFFIKALTADPASAGYYTAAQNIARVPYFLTVGLGAMLLPAVARASTRASDDAPAMVRDAIRFGVLLVAPLAAMIAGAAAPTVLVLYGDGYSPAAASLFVLGPAMACFAVAALGMSLLAGVGRPWYPAIAVGAGLVLTIVACSIFVPADGALGAATATLAGTAGTLVLIGGMIARVFHASIPWATLLRVGLAASAIGISARVVDDMAGLIVGIPLLAIAYGLLLILMRELKGEDWLRVTRLFPLRS